MKKPDNDTLTIWYSLVTFGVVTSFALSRFAGVRFIYSVWITVPTFLAVGILAMRWWMKSIDKRIATATTPLQVKEVSGVGELRQLPDYWAVELEVSEGKTAMAKLYVTIAADSTGPSERQLNLIRTLKEKYSQLKSILLESLQAYLASDGGPNVLGKIDLVEVSYDINPDGDQEDLEVTFPEKDGSDMIYVLCLKDWQVVNIYGAD